MSVYLGYELNNPFEGPAFGSRTVATERYMFVFFKWQNIVMYIAGRYFNNDTESCVARKSN